MNKDKEHI